MPGLDELRVSLTKNGYFKVAEVIKQHPRAEVLDNIDGVHPGINLHRAQIANMLSADEATEELPPEWDEIRSYSPRAIEAFTFISILFSHVDFITKFAKSRIAEMRGVLRRADFGEKVFTNLVYSMQGIGLCDYKPGADDVEYNLAPLFQEMSIGPLVKRILRRKLEKTGWHEPETDDHFTRDFYEQCFYYKFHETLGVSEQQFTDWLEGRSVQIEAPPDVHFSDKNVTVSASLLAALAAKSFVIVAGSTGTGKTATIRHCADALRPENAPLTFNHVFIPVEAGWTDSRHLLGYRNPFGREGETYHPTALLSLLLRANHPAYKAVPFFIILDEMNLSYVEMYFSRFLSLMETAAHGRPEPLVNVDDLHVMLRSGVTGLDVSYIEHAIKSDGLFLSANVFIVGTVNVDETTHMFSPKVLDRSFVLQFSTVKPSMKADTFEISATDRVTAKQAALAEFLLSGKTLAPSKRLDPFFDEVHEQLGRFAFGPRVTHEVQRYIAATDKLAGVGQCDTTFTSDASLKDRLLMQKILPKLRGNRSQIGKLVDALAAKAREQSLTNSAAKLDAMKGDLASPGFSNYFA